MVNILVYPHILKTSSSTNSSVANHLLFCDHSASHDDSSIITCENKKLLLELKEKLLIMRDHPSLNITNITSTPSAGPSIKIFVRILFPFNSCYIILIEWTFYYFVMRKCISIAVCVNGTLKFTFYLVMRLNITIVLSCDTL